MKNIETLNVKLKSRSYPIYIGKSLLKDFNQLVRNFESYSNVILITDNKVKKNLGGYIDTLSKSVNKNFSTINLPSGEKTKSYQYLEFLCEKILEKKIDRNSLLICFGGGVIGDLVGLVANLLLRGIDFVQVPTTLLSQVDSSVGGKTAINSKFGKNLVGTFNQPKAVIISLDTLQSLPKRQIFSGYAEILKYSLIKDKSFFHWLEENGDKVISLDYPYLSYSIKKSCTIKSKIVSADEKESGIREILNFGHTFGHAIESLTGFSDKVLHGEAVFLGMHLAIKYSHFLGICSKDIISDYQKHLNKLKIPFSLNDYNFKLKSNDFIKHLRFDKKIKNSQLKFILLKRYGKTKSYMLHNEKKLLDFLNKNL